MDYAIPRPWGGAQRYGSAPAALRLGQHLQPAYALLHPIPPQCAARTERRHGARDRLYRLREPETRIAAGIQRGIPYCRYDIICGTSVAVSGTRPIPGGRRERQGKLQRLEREVAAPVLEGSDLYVWIHLVKIDRPGQRHPCSRHGCAVSSKQL